MKWIKATRKYRNDFLCEYTLECSHRTATLSGETRRNFKGVCQKLNTELPDFSLAFFYFFPRLSLEFQNPLKIRNFWNSSKFRSFFLIAVLKKDSLIFPEFPWLFKGYSEFSDFSLTSMTWQTPWICRAIVTNFSSMTKISPEGKFCLSECFI